MSVSSELLLNTQNSFQTHAQRGANIVMRGGKRKSKRRKSRRKRRRRGGGHPTKVAVRQQRNKIEYKQKQIVEANTEEKVGLEKELQELENELVILEENAKVFDARQAEARKAGLLKPDGGGGKRKSKRTKRMARKSRKKQRGGRGRTITYSNLDFMANNRLGKMVPHGDPYTNCNTQSGGGFGFTQEGANDAATFKGSYPAYQKYEKSKQCGGKRRRRRKKSRKKKKSRRRKKSRKRTKKRRRRKRRKRGGCGCALSRKKHQHGGSSHTYGAPVSGGTKPWATAPLGISKNAPSCYDNYNHFKGL